MDFELSEELVSLQDMARELLAERWGGDPVRKGLDRPPVRIPDELWVELAQLGWLGVACDEAVGGGGQDLMTAAILSTEAGRGLLPGALVTTLAAAMALDRSEDEALRQNVLSEVIAGRRRVSIACEEANGEWGPEHVAMVAAASADGRELTLSGTKILVPDGMTATTFLVVARVGEGLAFLPVAADAAGLTVTPMQRIDGEDIAELRFDEVRVPAGAVLGGAAADALVRSTYDRWTVLLAANLLGDAEAVLHQTNEYVKQRVQFGRPIGSFQAVSHRLADVLVAVEIGRSLCYAACLYLDEGHAEAGLFTSAAKAWMSEAAVEAAEAALQLHGGIGYTWELDVHLHLRRVRANAVSLGDAAWHRERIARHLAARYRS